MSTENEPAFPIHWENHSEGMTKREYAAIALKVPTSGTEWLDDMIRESLRNDFAAKVIQGAISSCAARGEVAMLLAGLSYEIADAMLAVKEKS